MNLNIPNEWKQVSLNDICEKVTDGSHNPPKGTETGLPMLSAKNIHDGIIDFQATHRLIPLEQFQSEDRRTSVTSGDILLTIVGALGRVAVVPDGFPKFTLQRSVAVLAAPNIDSIFFGLALKDSSFQTQVFNNAKGTAQKGIYLKKLRELTVALPPLAEQKVIADKLDELLAQVESTKARLDAIPAILKSFRQSVLAAAVSGKLTEEWRGGNVCEAIKNLIEKNVAKKNGKLRVPKKSKWDQDIDLFSLPNGWSWTENHKLAIDANTAICAGPFGTIFKAKDFRESGVPIIFLRHVKESGFNQRKPNYMDEAVWSEYHQDYSIYGGELLVTKLGEPPGESCIYPNDFGTAMVTPDVLKMNVDAEVADIKYLMHFFNSPVSKKMVGDAAFGATRLRIDIPLFKSFPIPLPPRDEQTEIVRRVEELFTFADKVEAQVNAAQTRVNNLTQSILAKAFRGELTADWRAANPALITGDNSAEALLERIKAERDALAVKKKPAKKPGEKKVTA